MLVRLCQGVDAVRSHAKHYRFINRFDILS